ncbi:MAG: response regulator transcription factor [Chloroflexi bacterium AL-W]|nr:response regulator transcription factor [Chloroflexi bacterium AL-N1]NOK66270.1 response regulator transcription factor [Chloroflexi bacterium AL-N10]NOK73150.1 response regulator transcription factor [Chloroflexi bacterium AL-N5]NOK80047.1 response regulator transcription factor [Chloroflexi bacterium AL-W]NOK88098.1 response regulator transcription factor [Chloroflexi bacterium AL-N15]
MLKTEAVTPATRAGQHPTLMSTILLVEDDPTLSEMLSYNLEREGYRVLVAEDGVVGLEQARREQPDLIILDIMLPRLDGFSVCRILRQESDIPILMLTARQDEVDRIAGLELGADDYVSKPFSLGELLARVRAILRRSERQPTNNNREVLEAGAVRIDTGSRRAWRSANELSLSQKEFDLLTCLVRNRGMALSRDVLLERVWGYDFLGDSRTVDVHVRWLREKVEPDPGRPIYIQTVRGVGYRFEAPSLEREHTV